MLRKYAIPTTTVLRHVRRHSTQSLPIELETFGRLGPWASENLSSDSFASVLVRHYEHRPYGVQRALITQIANNDNATTRIEDNASPSLDLTPFETTSGLIFLFWLFNRRLPSLHHDCVLPPSTPPTTPSNEHELKLDSLTRLAHRRLQSETFDLGLIDAWRLGSCLCAPRFQNDVLKLVARRLESSEREALRSDVLDGSHAVKWARQAFDALSPSALESFEDAAKGRELRDFAVDVAAKRVYEVGMNSMLLSFSERENLGTNPQFASEVFGSLGGQIGTKGISIVDFARAYMVEEDIK